MVTSAAAAATARPSRKRSGSLAACASGDSAAGASATTGDLSPKPPDPGRVHVINPGAGTANVTVSVPGQPACSVSGAGQEQFFTCPSGFGGPVLVSSNQPALASQRVQYYQSFNEVLAE